MLAEEKRCQWILLKATGFNIALSQGTVGKDRLTIVINCATAVPVSPNS
jgi:hypothetical protein